MALFLSRFSLKVWWRFYFVFAAVAQWIEQRTPDPQVAGSTPVSRACGQKPVIRLHGKYAANYAQSEIILSLTHIKSLSAAVVIAITKT